MKYKLQISAILMCINQTLNTSHMAPKNKKKSCAKMIETQHEEEKLLRRSSRSIKAKSDNDFLVGQQEIDRCIGKDASDEEIGGKRPRKYNYYDQYSDYDEMHRHPKKRLRLPTSNRVQALLEWKDQQIILPNPDDFNSKIVKVKSICKEHLDKHAEKIEALFINIDWGKKGQTIQDFKNLKIESYKLMDKGLIFIWVPKNLCFEVLQIMKQKQFFYVQNLEIVNLDRKKAISLSKTCRDLKIQVEEPISERQVSEKKKNKEEKKTTLDSEENQRIDLKTIVAGLQHVDPNDLILEKSSQYFNESKRTLLMMRRKAEEKLELRHQRTCDVVFDMPENPSGKCPLDTKKYIYGMIETLLPRCLESEEGLKMMELWGDLDSRRRGWITMIEG